LGKYDIPIMLLARLAVDHRELKLFLPVQLSS